MWSGGTGADVGLAGVVVGSAVPPVRRKPGWSVRAGAAVDGAAFLFQSEWIWPFWAGSGVDNNDNTHTHTLARAHTHTERASTQLETRLTFYPTHYMRAYTRTHAVHGKGSVTRVIDALERYWTLCSDTQCHMCDTATFPRLCNHDLWFLRATVYLCFTAGLNHLIDMNNRNTPIKTLDIVKSHCACLLWLKEKQFMKFYFKRQTRDRRRAKRAQQRAICSFEHGILLLRPQIDHIHQGSLSGVSQWCSRALPVNNLFGLHGCRKEVRTYWGYK